MPTSYGLKPHDIDPRRWEACRRQVAADMVAAGWSRHAGKFCEVQMRRALRLFRTTS